MSGSAPKARRSTPTSAGRKGEAYYRFRQRPIVRSWTGFSDQPSYDVAAEVGRTLIDSFVKDPGEEGDVDEVHVVYTRFRSMLTQEPTAIRLLPLEVVEGEEKPEASRCSRSTSSNRRPRPCSTRCFRSTSRAGSSTRCSSPRHPSSRPGRRR